jgi:hypothetical protein
LEPGIKAPLLIAMEPSVKPKLAVTQTGPHDQKQQSSNTSGAARSKQFAVSFGSYLAGTANGLCFLQVWVVSRSFLMLAQNKTWVGKWKGKRKPTRNSFNEVDPNQYQTKHPLSACIYSASSWCGVNPVDSDLPTDSW